MIESGNTTLWETFDCGGSDNHVFLGDLTAWFMSYLAGIRHDPANPGFQRFLIKPEVVSGLTWAKGRHDSPYGRIESEWRREDNDFSLKITVPANSVAEVSIPASKPGEVNESGKSVTEADGVKFLRMEKGRALFDVVSGVYNFTVSK